jgi:asparagine N-glycosylation enzyme membrane subunit Stt3
VAELLYGTWMVYAFVRTWSDVTAGRLATGLLAGATVLAFWNWQGSALALFPLVLWAGVWRVAAPPGDTTSLRALRALAWGSAGAAAILAATVAAWGPPGAFSRPSLSGIGVTHVAMCVVSAAFGGLLAAAGRWCGVRGRVRRAGEVAVAAIVPVAASLLIPPIRSGVAHGMTALGAANPWYQTIDEFRPLFGGAASVAEFVVMSMAGFGGCLLAVPVAAVALLYRWRREPADRPHIAFLVLWGALFLLLALARKRFALYLVVPLALWCEVAVCEVAQAASRRWAVHAALARRAVTVSAALLLVGPALPMVWMAGHVAPDRLQDEILIPLAQELRVMVAPPGRPAVMATWSAGHVIQYFAGKPVVATPFGTDLGPEGMRDLARFQFSSEPEDAEELLSRRRVGFVLLQAPATEGKVMLGFLPPDSPRRLGLVRDERGRRLHMVPGYAHMVTSRLYHFDGMSPSSEPLATLAAYRLLAESSGSALDFGSDLPGHHTSSSGSCPDSG